MNIIQAIKDPNLFESFLDQGKGLESWMGWMQICRAIYGHPITSRRGRKFIKETTGRDARKLPSDGADVCTLLTGRRSGKSRMAAVIAAFEAVLAGHHEKLAKGEMGLVPIISPTKSQSRIVKNYIRSIFQIPLLRNEVVDEQREGFTLKNGVRIEILAGDWRTIRGFTLLAAIIDEAAFFGLDAESKVKSDTELIRSILPALSTTNGKLIAISSPYAMKGWCYDQWKRYFGNDEATTLVVNCSSRTLNPLLKQSIVDKALAEDYQAAKSEYLGEFRDDVGIFLPRAVIEQVVIKGRKELLPRTDRRYVSYVDTSGGRSDCFSIGVAHREKSKVIVDFLKRWKPPLSPTQVVGEMADILRRYQVRKVTGDNYAGDWPVEQFQNQGIRYLKSEKPASGLYLELLPRICSGEIELLDDDVMVNQLANLERRVRSGGKDVIDHPPGGHDDVANAVAGVTEVAVAKRLHAGAMF